MSAPVSDALVFYGATGDLAYKKIFPALHGMIRRGALDVPIIAVAKESWSLEQLRARARESRGGASPGCAATNAESAGSASEGDLPRRPAASAA